jgi:hypothetical protein
MVSAKTIKSYDFNTIEEYFEYILDSITNGQRKQAKDLFVELSGKQKLSFYHYIDTNGHSLVNILDIVNSHQR